MHRRARHLTGRPAGASFHYDARWLNLTDGTGVSTWTDISGSNNASQVTSTNQPTFKTNIINGNPVVRFDGTNDFMSMTSGTDIAGESVNIVLVKKSGAQLPIAINKTAGLPYVNFYVDSLTTVFSCAGNNRYYQAVVSLASFAIVTSYTDSSSTYQIYKDGSSVSTTNFAFTFSGNMTHIGARDSGPDWANGDMAVILHIKGSLATSLRKRYEHSVGFSYKTACS